ncbi:hypothetical protein F5Y18DRAFT_251890 [Xylariaceae sp. FL1019]|nr:hypothetical protein F5Y18DRAFT_251890 [Xylariaceae sp. FL1019]
MTGCQRVWCVTSRHRVQVVVPAALRCRAFSFSCLVLRNQGLWVPHGEGLREGWRDVPDLVRASGGACRDRAFLSASMEGFVRCLETGVPQGFKTGLEGAYAHGQGLQEVPKFGIWRVWSTWRYGDLSGFQKQEQEGNKTGVPACTGRRRASRLDWSACEYGTPQGFKNWRCLTLN